MSGVVPGVEDPKLEQVEQTLKNDPLAAREIAEAAIARAAVTLTQPAATMAGYVVGNEASQNQTALDYALQQMGQATAQEAANQEASNNDVFSGVDNDETRRKIAGLAALGVLTKNGGAEETPEEKREKELNELSTITLLQQQLAAINDDLNLYGAQIEAMESRLQETEPAINNAYTLMEQQLAELDQQLREQSETLKNAQEEMRILKERQAAGEQISPERIEQLQIRIDAARE